MSQLQHQQSNQSFYSVYSHQSAFDAVNRPQTSPINQNLLKLQPSQKTNLQVQQRYMSSDPSPKMLKIARSNINLDDCIIDIQNQSRSSNIDQQRMSFKTVVTNYQQRLEKQRNQNKDSRKMIEIMEQSNKLNNNEISGIQYKQDLNASMCLLKQIDCLSVQQVSPAQMRQIKKKIDLLKHQQLVLQNSLSMATHVIQTTKTRNAFLQQQILKYKNNQKQQPQMSAVKVKQQKNNEIDKQQRIFTQNCNQQNFNKNINNGTTNENNDLKKLKNIYKQCSMGEYYCIYQNQGYKIQVTYNRQKNFGDPKMLILCIKLTPHHHIVNRKQFRFGLQIQKSKQHKIHIDNLSYEGAMLMQQYSLWPLQLFSIPVIVHQLDELTRKNHTHTILVPLPITHFLQPRFIFLSQQYLTNIKSKLSKYSLNFTGLKKQNMGTMSQRLKNLWWINKFISVIGLTQIIFVEVLQNLGQEKQRANIANNQQTIQVTVFGKKNGVVLKGIIQYLTFFISN